MKSITLICSNCKGKNRFLDILNSRIWVWTCKWCREQNSEESPV